METVESIIAISGGIVAIVGGLVALWFRLRKKPDAKPTISAGKESTVIGGGAKNSAVASGKQSAAAVDKGVAIGSGQQGPIVIAQQGSNVSINTNTTVRREELQTSEVTAVRDPFRKGIRLQEEDRHDEAIRAFEKAFAAAPNEEIRVSIHIQIGLSLMSLSRLPQAEGHFREAADALGHDRPAEDPREKSDEH